MDKVFPGMAWSAFQKAGPGMAGSLGQITRDNPYGPDIF
jgi:hypothetical protein